MSTFIVDGREIALGCVLRTKSDAPGAGVLPFALAMQEIDEAKWKDRDWSRDCGEMLDQGSTFMCTAFATVAAMHAVRKQNGWKMVRLSPSNLYRRVTDGSGRGIPLSGALIAAREQGICSKDFVQCSDTEWMNACPAGWEQDSRKQRVNKIFDCRTFEQIATAVQSGWFVITAINVGENFFRALYQNPGGVVPPDPTGQIGGHAVLVVGMRKNLSGKWELKIQNSWGKVWGDNGFGWVPDTYWRNQDFFTDGWCILSSVA